ncbi:unnamed protein product [marine sediment metagenome]|uniref:Uncharacterized protein n=2 Tax=marine sediment metagenome TaxID=412755 RepID=X1P3T6_9ZZZZ
MAYKLITDFVYSLGETYEGEAASSTFEFGTPAGVIAGPIADHMIDEFEAQCLDEGLHMLRLKVWADTSPILETKFFCQMICCPASEHSPLPVWVIPLMPKIISAVVAIAVAVLIYLSVREVKEIFYSPAGPKVAEALKWIGIGLGATGVAAIISKTWPRRAKEAS